VSRPRPAATGKATARVTGRCEQVHAGDRVRFIRPYLDRGTEWSYVANGTAGQVLAVGADHGLVTVGADHGLVTVGCDDGRTVTLQPAALEESQPLRLGYASHALKLQGGQAPVVLVLAGGWQATRQSAYSMATRCVEELHVYIDAEAQQSGPYRDHDPVEALAQRWARDGKKRAASTRLAGWEEHGSRPGDRWPTTWWWHHPSGASRHRHGWAS
jgi:hypothetical protein